MKEKELIELLTSIIEANRTFYVGAASPINNDGEVSINGISAKVIGASNTNDVIVKDSQTGAWYAFIRNFRNQIISERNLRLYQKEPSRKKTATFFVMGFGCEIPVDPDPNNLEQSTPIFVQYLIQQYGAILYGEYPAYNGNIAPWILDISPTISNEFYWGKTVVPHAVKAIDDAAFVTIDVPQFPYFYQGLIAEGAEGNEPLSGTFNSASPIDSDYWLVYLPAEPIVISINRISPSVDLAAWVFKGVYEEPLVSLNEADPNFIGFGDDEISPPGDPQISFTPEEAGYYTVIVTAFASTIGDRRYSIDVIGTIADPPEIPPVYGLKLSNRKLTGTGKTNGSRIIKPKQTENPLLPKSSLLKYKVETELREGKFSFFIGQDKITQVGGNFGYSGLQKSLGIGFELKGRKNYRAVQKLYLHRFVLKELHPYPYIDFLTDYPLGKNISDVAPEPEIVESFKDSAFAIASTPSTFYEECLDGVCTPSTGSTTGYGFAPRQWVVYFQWKTNITESIKELSTVSNAVGTGRNRITLEFEINPWTALVPNANKEVLTILTNTGALGTSGSPFISYDNISNLRLEWRATYNWSDGTTSTPEQTFSYTREADEEWIEFNINDLGAEEEVEFVVDNLIVETVLSPLPKPPTGTNLKLKWEVFYYWVNPITETDVQSFTVEQINPSDAWVQWLSYRTNFSIVKAPNISEEEVEFYTSDGDPYIPLVGGLEINLKSPFRRVGDATNLYIAIGQVSEGATIEYQHELGETGYTGFHGGYSLENFHYPCRQFFFGLIYRWNETNDITIEPDSTTTVTGDSYSPPKKLKLRRELVSSLKAVDLFIDRPYLTAGGATETRKQYLSVVNDLPPGVETYPAPPGKAVFDDGEPNIRALLDPSTGNVFLPQYDGERIVTELRILAEPQYYYVFNPDGFLYASTRQVTPGFSSAGFVTLDGDLLSPENFFAETSSGDYIYPVTLQIEEVAQLYQELIYVENQDGVLLETLTSPYVYYKRPAPTFSVDLIFPLAENTVTGFFQAFVFIRDVLSGTYKGGNLRKLFIQEGGYEFLIGKPRQTASFDLFSLITLPNEIVSYDLNMDFRTPSRAKVQDIIHLSPEGTTSETVTLSEPGSILIGDLVINTTGKITYKEANFYPYFAKLYSESIDSGAGFGNPSGFIEYTEGLIADMEGGSVYPCFSIFFGRNKSVTGGSFLTPAVDFECIFIDTEDGNFDVIYRYQAEYFRIGFFPDGLWINSLMQALIWDTTTFDTGFRTAPDPTNSENASTTGLAIAGIEVETGGTILHQCSYARGLETLPTSLLGSNKVGDFLWRLDAFGNITGYDNLYLFEAGNVASPVKAFASPIPLSPAAFYCYLRFEILSVEGNSTSKITFYITPKEEPYDAAQLFAPPIFASQTIVPDPLGDNPLQDANKVIKKLLG